MQVKNVMTKSPLCCTPGCTAQIAAMMMKEGDTGILPVIEEGKKRLTGVVTDRDLCLEVIASGRSPDDVTVEECMTTEPICSHSDDDLHTAMELMSYYQVRRIMVVNERNEVEGVLSVGDLIRSERTSTEQVMRTLKSICEPGRRGSRPRQQVVRKAA